MEGVYLQLILSSPPRSPLSNGELQLRGLFREFLGVGGGGGGLQSTRDTPLRHHFSELSFVKSLTNIGQMNHI